MTTKHDLYLLIDELPDSAFGPAEAILAFLLDRAMDGERRSERSPGRLAGQGWVEDERRGIEKRRRDRDAGGDDPDDGDIA